MASGSARNAAKEPSIRSHSLYPELSKLVRENFLMDSTKKELLTANLIVLLDCQRNKSGFDEQGSFFVFNRCCYTFATKPHHFIVLGRFKPGGGAHVIVKGHAADSQDGAFDQFQRAVGELVWQELVRNVKHMIT